VSSRVGRLFHGIAPYLGLIAVVLVFALLYEDQGFLSPRNFRVVAMQTVIVALGALGMTFVIVSGGIDLSVGSVIALAGVVTALLAQHEVPVSLAVLGGCSTGAICGLLNGLMITQLSIAPFIATLGMYGMARGFAQFLGDEQKVNAPPTWVSDAMAHSPTWYPEWWSEWLQLAPAVWLLFGLALAMAVVLRKTVFGVHTFAVGSNEATARLCGIRVWRTKLGVYALAGGFAGLAGVMNFGRLTVGDPNEAVGAELHVIAAVVIGGASLAGGEGRISGALVGAFLMSVLANGCTLSGVPNYVQQILVGAIIVLAVALDSLRHRGRREM